MSDHDDHTELSNRIQELTDECNRQADQRQRRTKLTAILGGIIVLIVVFGLSNVTSLAGRLDADTIAQISRQQIQERLPDARQRVQDYLEEEAPTIVSNTMLSLMDTIPQLRAFVFKSLMTRIDELNFQFEKNTIEIMAQFVDKSKKEIDAAFPDATDREKVEKLVAAVSKQFETTIKEATAALYPDYEREMGRLVAHLDTLETTDPQKLTEEQRIHREIFETLLQILDRRDATASPGR